MRRFVFLLLCCLLFCLPALGEECIFSERDGSAGVDVVRGEAGDTLTLYRLENGKWLRADDEILLPGVDGLPRVHIAGDSVALSYPDNRSFETFTFRYRAGAWHWQGFENSELSIVSREDEPDVYDLRAAYCGYPLYEYGLGWERRTGGFPRTLYAFFQVMKPAGERTALVDNPSPRDRLHLRARPDREAKSLGKYYSGTPVEILGYPNEIWAHVRIGTREGYMLRAYLAADAIAVAAPPIVTIRNTSGTGLNLRAAPESKGKIIRLIENGERVTVLGVTKNYLHVRAGADTGFIRNKGTTPALDYHSSEITPAFRSREAMTLEDCTAYARPHLTEGEAGVTLHALDTYRFTGLYGLFAEIEYKEQVLYLPMDEDNLNWG